MSHKQYLIPAITLSFSCSSTEAVKVLCDATRSDDSNENLILGDEWREEYCLSPQGRWKARRFGYTYLPIEYSFYDNYSYTLNIYLDIEDSDEAILSVQRTMTFYDVSDSYSYQYNGVWFQYSTEIYVSIYDNYLYLSMECTVDADTLDCVLSNGYMGDTAWFERVL